MKKGITLQLALVAPNQQSVEAARDFVEEVLTGEHEGLQVNVLNVGPARGANVAVGTLQAVVHVQGDRPSAEDFAKVATSAVQRLWESNSGVPAVAALGVAGALPAMTTSRLVSIADVENYQPDEEGAELGVAAVGVSRSRCIAAPPAHGVAVGPTAAEGLPDLAAADLAPAMSRSRRGGRGRATGAGTFHGCPLQGDGADRATNKLKNRSDVGQWQQSSVGAILSLTWPPGLPQTRDRWSAQDLAAIRQVEGQPLQVEGFLAGVAVEGEEACNCHSQQDVDFHTWLVAAAGQDRSASIVCEVSPRVRANHPGWTFNRICSLVSHGARVRVSGWLMLDPQHPDQVGGTRGTIWEIHPVMQIEVADGGGWTDLDALNM